jgi:hypothetical protein
MKFGVRARRLVLREVDRGSEGADARRSHRDADCQTGRAGMCSPRPAGSGPFYCLPKKISPEAASSSPTV